MMLPHFIDALRNPKAHDLLLVDGAAGRVAETLALLERSEKFDFGALDLEDSGERAPSDNSVIWNVPKLTTEEEQYMDEGLIPLPSDVCWYEFTLNGHHSGLIVRQMERGLEIMRCDYNHKKRRGAFDACWLSYRDGFRGLDAQGNHAIAINGPGTFLQQMAKKPQFMREMHYGSIIPLAEYLTLMINSQSTEIVDIPAPVKLNKRRQAKGKTPLPAHRVVTIIPHWLRHEIAVSHGGTHASPRLHSRRSHKRHFEHQLQNNMAKWMPNEIWHGKTGWWCIVIPRYFVGKKELGEVSHTYRIAPIHKPEEHT